MSLKTNARHIPRQFRDYTRTIGWIARDAASRFKSQAMAISAMNLVGVITGAASLGGIVLLAKHAGSNVPMKLGKFEIEISTSSGSLIGYAAAMAGLGILSGFVLYAAEKLILSVTVAYEKHNSERVVGFIHDPLCRGWTDLLNRPIGANLLRLRGPGSRYAAYVVRDLLRSILPLLTFVFALAMLLWIDVGVTLLLLPLVIVYLIPLYLINLAISKLQSEFRRMHSVVRKSATRAWRQTFLGSDEKMTAEDSAAVMRDSDQLRLVHYRRMLTPKAVQLLNTVFAMVCLLTLLVYFTIDTRVHGRPWADLLAYIVALRFAVSGLRQVSATVAKLSRYLPEYRSYVRVIEGANRIANRRRTLAEKHEAWPENITIRLGRNAAWDSPRRLTMTPAQVLWILVPDSGDFSSADLGAIASRVEQRLQHPTNFAANAKIITDVAKSNGTLDAEVNSTVDSTRMSPNSCPVIIDATKFRGKTDLANNCLKVGSNRFTILVESDPDALLQSQNGLGDPNAAGVVLFNERKVVAGGDLHWLRAHLDDVAKALKSLAVPDDLRESNDDEDDDDADV
jgi:ABC-type multidrug transport system fused ATPase/permease subunit